MLKRVVTGLAASVAALAIAVLGLEVGLRMMGYGSDAIARPHAWTGWVLTPHLRATIQSEDKSLGKRVHFTTNSLGLHDVERTVEKPPGVYRVLVVGDSYTMAAQVPLDSALSRRLERALDGREGRRIEVWNCGIDGYSPGQELLFLQHVAERFHPDFVVLCFYSGNDVGEQMPELAMGLRGRPYFHLNGDGLALDRGHFQAEWRTLDWVRAHSRLAAWANVQRRVIVMKRQLRRAEQWSGPGVPPELQLYAEQPDSVWSTAWTLTERLIVAVRDEVERQGAEFMLVYISAGVEEHADARRRSIGWAGWQERPGLSLDHPESRIGRLAAASGMDYLSLRDAFRESEARTGMPLHITWTGHWNSAGHALAARMIGERLAARIGLAHDASKREPVRVAGGHE